MQVRSSISEKWKLCIIASILCCFILVFILQQYDYFTYGALPYSESEPPISSSPLASIITESPPPNNISVSVTPPPPPIPMPSINFSFELKTEKPTSPSLKPDLGKPHKNKNKNKCDIFDGRWVYRPQQKPSYDTIKCPFVEEKMSCMKNGRPDVHYQYWTWQPKHCLLPLFNARDMLERLRNKRLIIVGDSLNRNMWYSLACLLYSSIKPSRAQVYAKIRDYKYLKAKDYNTIIEFHWNPFLVEFDERNKTGKRLLVLDKISSKSKLWRGADIMVFNTGHWWTHRGNFKRWDLFQYKKQLKEKMPKLLAYDIGMKTWAKWIQKYVDPKKTVVFFRSISSTHNVGKQWCYNKTQPIVDESYENPFPRSMINVVESLLKDMSKSKVHVKYLNVTKLSKYRNDAHPSVYRTSKWRIFSKYKRLIPSYADCSHWCLPGVPDTWNQLLYASMLLT